MAVITWDTVFVATAEITGNSTSDTNHEGDVPGGVTAGSMPRSMKALGTVVLILGVLFSILHIIGGGGPWRHAPC